jgi:hypothetical protein
VLSHKQRATPAVPPIFDGEKEAELIALACSKPSQGRARWSSRLLENKVVELGIVDRASDSTIGRTDGHSVCNSRRPHVCCCLHWSGPFYGRAQEYAESIHYAYGYLLQRAFIRLLIGYGPLH